MQSHHLQGAHYACLLKLHSVKIVIYGSSVYDWVIGYVAAYIGSVLVGVCMSHFSGVELLLNCEQDRQFTYNVRLRRGRSTNVAVEKQ